MTPEEREAVRELIATLPRCERLLGDDEPVFEECEHVATRYGTAYSGDDDKHYCDKHGAGEVELDYAPALRKLQALMG